MGTGIGFLQDIHLTMEVLVLLASQQAVGNGLVDLVTGIDDGLHVLLLQVFLRQLGNLLVGNQLATGKDGLGQGSHRIQQYLAGIDHHTASGIGPASGTVQRDGREECGTGGIRVIEGLLHSVVGHADVRTVLQHHGRNTDVEITDVEHALTYVALGLGVRQYRVAPLAAADVLRCNGQQATDGILDAEDVATHVGNLGLHVEVRRLHLVDGRAIRLTILPEGNLCLQRGFPQAVGLRENLQLSVEHLQQVVLLGGGGNEVGTDGLLAHLDLQHHGLGGTLLVGDATKHVDIPRQLQRQVVGLRPGVVVKLRQRSRRCEVQCRQIGQLGSLQRRLRLLDGDACRVQVGVVGQHLLDELLQQRVAEELAPRHLGDRVRVGLGDRFVEHTGTKDVVGRLCLVFILAIDAASREHHARGYSG